MNLDPLSLTTPPITRSRSFSTDFVKIKKKPCFSRRRRTYVQELVRYLGNEKMMSGYRRDLCSVGKWLRYVATVESFYI